MRSEIEQYNNVLIYGIRTNVLNGVMFIIQRDLSREVAKLHCSFFLGDRLLLSIDRRQSIPEASDTVKLAQEYAQSSSVLEQGRVVGIDLSGDPNVSLSSPVTIIIVQG